MARREPEFSFFNNFKNSVCLRFKLRDTPWLNKKRDARLRRADFPYSQKIAMPVFTGKTFGSRWPVCRCRRGFWLVVRKNRGHVRSRFFINNLMKNFGVGSVSSSQRLIGRFVDTKMRGYTALRKDRKSGAISRKKCKEIADLFHKMLLIKFLRLQRAQVLVRQIVSERGKMLE